MNYLYNKDDARWNVIVARPICQPRLVAIINYEDTNLLSVYTWEQCSGLRQWAVMRVLKGAVFVHSEETTISILINCNDTRERLRI